MSKEAELLGWLERNGWTSLSECERRGFRHEDLLQAYGDRLVRRDGFGEDGAVCVIPVLGTDDAIGFAKKCGMEPVPGREYFACVQVSIRNEDWVDIFGDPFRSENREMWKERSSCLGVVLTRGEDGMRIDHNPFMQMIQGGVGIDGMLWKTGDPMPWREKCFEPNVHVEKDPDDPGKLMCHVSISAGEMTGDLAHATIGPVDRIEKVHPVDHMEISFSVDNSTGDDLRKMARLFGMYEYHTSVVYIDSETGRAVEKHGPDGDGWEEQFDPYLDAIPKRIDAVHEELVGCFGREKVWYRQYRRVSPKSQRYGHESLLREECRNTGTPAGVWPEKHPGGAVKYRKED